MKRATLIALLASSGCDVVYGLDGRREAGAPIRVEGTFTSVWAFNNPDGTPTTRALPVADASRPVVRSFGETIPIDFDPATGAFSFDAPVPYELRFGLVEYQSSSPSLVLDEVWFGRPDAVPAQDVSLSLVIEPPEQELARAYELVSTGVWNRTRVVVAASGAVPVAWHEGTFFGAQPAIVDASAGDTLTLVAFTSTAVSGQQILTRSASSAIAMKEGSQIVPFSLVPSPNQACATVVPSSADDIARLRARYPTFVDASSGGWEVDAVWQSPERGLRLALPLHSRYQGSGDSESLLATFGNPYPLPDLALTQASSITRVVDTISVAASVAHRQLITPSAASPCPEVVAAVSTPGLPYEIELDGVPLKNDRLAIGADEQRYLDLTWSIDGDKPDAYIVSLFETAGPQLVLVRTYNTVEPRVRMAASDFDPDKRYVLRVGTTIGRPQADTGDFTKRTLPDAFAQVFTSTFSVVQ